MYITTCRRAVSVLWCFLYADCIWWWVFLNLESHYSLLKIGDGPVVGKNISVKVVLFLSVDELVTSWRKEGKMPRSKDNNQVGNNQVGIGSKTQLLLLDDWMIVLRQFGETWSNWPKEVKHDTLVTHLEREQERERARLISMISDSKTLSRQNSQSWRRLYAEHTVFLISSSSNWFSKPPTSGLVIAAG